MSSNIIVKILFYLLSLISICIIVQSPVESRELISLWSLGELLFGIGCTSTIYNLSEDTVHPIVPFVLGIFTGIMVILAKYYQFIQ